MPFNIASDLYFDIKLLDVDLAWVSCLPKGLGERSALPLFRFHLSPFPPETPDTQADIDPIHGTCHLCTHFKIDRIKAICMFYIFQGGQTSYKVCQCKRLWSNLLFSQNETMILVFNSAIRFHSKVYVSIACWKTSMVATAFQKLEIITSTHNFPLSSLR